MLKKASALSRRPRFGGLFLPLAALLVPPSMTADAAIVYSGIQNLTIGTTGARGVDLDGRGEAELTMTAGTWRVFTPGHWVSTHLGIGSGWTYVPPRWDTVVQYSLAFSPSLDPVAGLSLSILGEDTLIGSGSVFSVQEASSLPDRLNGVDAWFGFRFNSAGDQTLYGWGRITFITGGPLGNRNTGLKLIDWAWEDSGAPIRAGQIPEPQTAVLLAATAGLTGAGLRRRRQENTRTLSHA